MLCDAVIAVAGLNWLALVGFVLLTVLIPMFAILVLRDPKTPPKTSKLIVMILVPTVAMIAIVAFHLWKNQQVLTPARAECIAAKQI